MYQEYNEWGIKMSYEKLKPVIDEVDLKEMEMYEKLRDSLIDLKKSIDPKYMEDDIKRIDGEIKAIENIIMSRLSELESQYSKSVF